MAEEMDEAPESEDASGAAETRAYQSFIDLKGEIKKDCEHHNKWRKAADEWYGLYGNDQWDEEARKVLEEQGRPPISMNRIQRNIQAVAGHEISNRQEIHCIPREEGDSKVSEIATAAVKWFRDESYAEDEESTAFLDTLIAGMGWTELRLDHDMDPDGAPCDTRIDPMEMFPDRFATRANLLDGTRITRIRTVPKATALAMFPEASIGELNATWAKNYIEADPAIRDREKPAYEGASDIDDDDVSDVTLVECQWIEREHYYRIAEPVMEPIVAPPGVDPMSGQPTPPQPVMDPMTGLPAMRQTGERMVDLSTDDFGTLKQRKAVIGEAMPKYQKARRICRYKAFLGATGYLEEPEKMEGPDPANPEKTVSAPAFTYNCITGNWDSKQRWWFGLVAPMADPQKWANKLLSQILHIINTSAKGGVMIEEDSVEDIRAFEASWARQDAVTIVPRNHLNPAAPKIVPKPTAQFPAGLDRMMQMSFESIGEATGISQELLGLRGASQPGVLEAQRTQRGLTILARYFDSLRRFRAIKGKLLIYIIQTQIPDGRMIRIVGPASEQYVPLLKSEMSGTYDIKVDETPTSPSVKDRTWGMIAPMFEKLPPPVQMELLPYSPLPESAVSKIREATAKLMDQGANKADPKVEAAKAQMELEGQRFQAEQQMKAAGMQAEMAMKREQAAIDTQIAREKAMAEMTLAKEKAAHDRELAMQKASDEYEIAVYRENLKAQNEARRMAAMPAEPGFPQ